MNGTACRTETRTMAEGASGRKGDGRIDPEVMEQIVSFIRQISYGEIVVTIHDSKVVQLEKKEKKRF
jgi:hypothetical protein